MGDLTHDEGTLRKVYDALEAAGMNNDQAIHAITNMQNAGIYFREAACGAPTGAGTCALPAGHNMGRADVPANHGS